MANVPRPSLEELEAYLKACEDEEKLAVEPSPREAKPAPKSEEIKTEDIKAIFSEPEEAEPAKAEKKPRKVKRKKSPLMVIWNIITTILVIAAVLLAVALVGVRAVGYTPYAVLSPSMTPTYEPGDLIYVKETPTDKIVEGDVITFVTDDKTTLVTHRVVEIDRDGRKFYTQGDANDSRDGNPVLYENVQGVVEFSLPKLGYVSSYVTSETGRYVAIAGIFALILLWILPELFRPEEKPMEEQTRAKD